MIGIAKEKVPVELSFNSTKPMSFTAAINFIDEDGNRFSVPVTGTTDNCLLTIQPFLDMNMDTVQLESQEVSPTSLVIPETQAWVMPSANEVSKADTTNLLRWLNATNMRVTIDDIPKDFVESKGTRLVELIEFVSGKSVPGKNIKMGVNKKEQAEQLVGQYEKILSHLKSYGALLNMVKPEFLLDLDNYRRIVGGMESKVALLTRPTADSDQLVHWQSLCEEDKWLQVSTSVWYSVLFQVFKIFVLSRVTPRLFKSTPGLANDTDPDMTLSGSNIYSVSENLLLKWLTINFQRAVPTLAYRLTNFHDDLRNGLAFYSVMVNHWPTLESFYSLLHKPCKLETHYQENAQSVLDMMEALQLPFTISVEDILEPRPRNMLVFVLYLYQTLPQLIPKTSVKFSGILGQTSTKCIELSNPSAKPISYSARLEGSNAFKLQESSVKLEPKSTCNFPVECTPQTSKPITGRLIFSSKREGGAHAATMVFSLDCLTQSHKPIVSVNMESKLYEMNTMPIEVANPFPGDCEFTVTIEQEMVKEVLPEEEAEKAKRNNRPTSRNQNGNKKDKKSAAAAAMLVEDDETAPQYPNAFGVDRRMLRMKLGERALLNAFFLPFELGKHRLTIMLENEKFGLFVYEVIGEALLPTPCSSLKIPCDTQNGPTSKEIPIIYPNLGLDAAKKLFLEKHPLSKVKEQAELIRSAKEMPKEMMYVIESTSSLLTCPASMIIKNLPGKGIKRAMGLDDEEPSGKDTTGGTPQPDADKASNGGGRRSSVASIEKITPKNSEMFVNNKDVAKDAVAGGVTPPNTLVVTLHPKGPGMYPGKIVLKSAVDVRVVDLEFVATASNVSATLEFECAARQLISQEIPLVNSGDKSLTIRAAITGDCFSGPRELVVPALSTEQYPLRFKPTWIGEYLGELSFTISNSNEANTYRLKGISEEPLAEGHVTIDCKARQSSSVTLTVPNLFGLDREATYTVYSDLSSVTGEPTLKVPTASTAPFELTISPSKSGVFHGSVTFTAPNGQYVWYTLDVNSARPPEEGNIQVQAKVREAVMIAIPLFNPTDEEISFNVYFMGDGVLGRSNLRIKPHESCEYELYFSPLFEMEGKGSVHFVSDAVGEFWYKLSLKATTAVEEMVEEMVCEVGTRTSRMVAVQNPLGEEVMLSASSSNTRNFTVSPSQLVIPPYGLADVSIEYIPSSLNEVETAEVTLQDPSVGVWVFKCSGHGLTPTVMETTYVTAGIGQSASSMVTFTNPFPAAISIALSLKTEEKAGVFGIMVKRMRGITMAPFANLQIPVAFSPERMALHKGELLVEVEGGDAIVWTFPLEGVSESLNQANTFRYKTKARTRLQDQLEVTLSGLGPLGKDEPFTHELVMQNPAERAALKRALHITANQHAITSPDEPLTFTLTFEPLRVLHTSVDFVITKASGGRWRFEIILEATEPDIDGTIVLESAVNQTDTKTINIVNPEPTSKSVPFSVALTPESAMEFTFTPMKGYLDGGNPTPVSVMFTPKEYGKMVVGRLVVQTDDMQWMYDLKGTRPKYDPPKGTSKVKADVQHTEEMESRIESASMTKSASKNFIRGNLTRKLNKK